MDKEIESLCADKFVSVRFKAKKIKLVGYHVSSGYHPSGQRKERIISGVQEIKGEVEGSFYFYMYGKVMEPSMWEGFTADFAVNGLGSENRFPYEQEGSLGYGFCENEIVWIRLYVNPQIARDILDEIIYYKKNSEFIKEEDREYSFRCNLVNIKRGGLEKHEGAITFEIGDLEC